MRTRFFGKYEILDEIARGGMGVVYRAREMGLNRVVALKMVQSHHLLSDEAQLRFRMEIESVAQLEHPHIAPLYESGEHEGANYFTMPLLEGGDLAAHWATRPPLRDAVRIMVKVCRAIHYAHQRGLIHRDLKPSNVLLDAQGEPHVVDFGLARPVDRESGFTFTSSVLGSPNYMAPEQAAGQTRQITMAADVYGLGAILFHAIAQRPPFQAGTPIETLRLVLDSDPAFPRPAVRDADPDLETIVLRCLHKEPGGRYESAEELARDLECWLEGRPIQARPVGLVARTWRWSGRHPLVATLGLALTLTLAALAVGAAVAVTRIQRAERQTTLHLRESLLREVVSHRLSGAQGHRAQILDLIRQSSDLGGSPDFRARLRNELLATLATTDLPFVPASHFPPATSPSEHQLDAQFQRLATIEGGNEVAIRSAQNGRVLLRFASRDGPITQILGFSPNGRFLALRHTNGFSVWQVSTATRCLSRSKTNSPPAFAASRNVVAFQDRPNEAVLVELPSGIERSRWRSTKPRLGQRATGWHSLAFSPDGRWLAGASGTSRLVEIMDPATGAQLQLLTNSAHTVAMHWNRRDQSLAVATADGRVFIWDVEAGALLWSTPTLVAPVQSLAADPSDHWLALVCGDGVVRFVDPQAQQFLFEFAAEGDRPAFAPDGNRFGPLWAEGQPGFIERRNPTEFAQFRAGGDWLRLTGARFSPDGRILAVGHLSTVALCDPHSAVRLWTRGDWRMAACLFHPAESVLLAAGTNQLARLGYSWSESGRLLLAKPERLLDWGTWRALDMTADGRFLAGFDGQSQSAYVFDHTLTNRLATLGPHTDAAYVALSPDAQWLATGSRSDLSVRLWEVATARPLGVWNVGLLAQGEFSRDGRWLAVFGDSGFQLLQTGSWSAVTNLALRPGRPVLGAATFSPDSRLLALVVDRFTVHLLDLATLASVGILRPPGTSPIAALAFSHDGRQLAAVGSEARVAIWRIDQARQVLSQFELDWPDAPRAPLP